MPEESKRAEAAKPKKRLSVSLSAKFSVFTFFLIVFVMGVVGYTLYIQQRRTLTHEVLERGKTIAKGAAASAKEAIVQKDDLTLSVLASRSVQVEPNEGLEKGYDFQNYQDDFDGLGDAFKNLQEELPGQIEKGLQALGLNLNLGWSAGAPKSQPKAQNEGVYECYILDQNGTVVAYHSAVDRKDADTNKVGTPYVAPKFVETATEETPNVYEQEWFDAKNARHVRRLFDVVEEISLPAENGKDVILGSVHLGLSQALIEQVIFEATMKLAVVGIWAVVIGLIFTFLVVNWMVRPIGKLLRGVLAIAGGDFDTRVKVTSRDELGELTGSFNGMAKSLGENEMLKGAFTRYVSDAALQQILSDPSKTGLHSRRALATVYTSDVRGFTAMSESLEPEHVVQVINTYLSLQTDVILKYEGVVDKFIGDATVGVFGKEQERDDDAIRAVKTALEVQKTIEALNTEREKNGEIAKLIGIGINTGIVVSGNMGSTKKMEYTTAGENVILADKLCAECPGGKVWISESTYELVQDEVVVEEKEPLKLKGRAEPFPVFEVTGLK
jgi:class 3 adenylate cyclase/HAMP domain-containing protein